jgi:hypothetical protein
VKSVRAEIAWPFPGPVSVRAWAKDHHPALVFTRWTMIHSIWRQRVAAIEAHFAHGTNEESEDRALALILDADSYAEIAFLLNALRWDRLDDDLDEIDLTGIAARISLLRDRDEHLLDRVLRRLSLEPEAFPDMSSVDVDAAIRDRVAALSGPGALRLATDIVDNRPPLRDAVALFARRGLPTRQREVGRLAEALAARVPALAGALRVFGWDAFYDDLIGSHLDVGRYRLLLAALPDMADAGLPAARRQACFDTLSRRDDALRAMQTFIAVMGTVQQRTDVELFMDARRLFLDRFTPEPPPATIIEEIAAFFGIVATEIGALRIGMAHATQGMTDALTFGHLLQTEADDQSREVVGVLGARRAVLPQRWKSLLVRLMEEGTCDDDDEHAILEVLRDTKAVSIAEFAALVEAQNWETLSFSFDGQEYDDLELLLSNW